MGNPEPPLYKRSNPAEWFAGPPPSIGWWPASWNCTPGVYRWWDGTRWSVSCIPSCGASEAAEHARIPEMTDLHIKWCARPDDWPERSKT